MRKTSLRRVSDKNRVSAVNKAVLYHNESKRYLPIKDGGMTIAEGNAQGLCTARQFADQMNIPTNIVLDRTYSCNIKPACNIRWPTHGRRGNDHYMFVRKELEAAFKKRPYKPRKKK